MAAQQWVRPPLDLDAGPWVSAVLAAPHFSCCLKDSSRCSPEPLALPGMLQLTFRMAWGCLHSFA